MPRLTRPAYAKSPMLGNRAIARLKPGRHSFQRDYPYGLDYAVDAFIAAKEYAGNPKIFGVQAVFFGVNRHGDERSSATNLIAIGSSVKFFTRLCEKALTSLQKSDFLRGRFTRMVYDVLKSDVQEAVKKKVARQETYARALNQARDYGFTNVRDYDRAVRELNAKYKHGASEAGLKQYAARLANQKARAKAKEIAAKEKARAIVAKARAKAKAITQKSKRK